MEFHLHISFPYLRDFINENKITKSRATPHALLAAEVQFNVA
jgi:hypothetical protein